MAVTIIESVISFFIGCALVFIFFYMAKGSRTKPTTYQVKIHFAHGIKIKLVLNPEQYEQLEAFLLQTDGYWKIGDESDSIKVYREFICLVEVKRK